MLSTRLHQVVDGFDEILTADTNDYQRSGLKAASVIRLGRLAVVSEEMLLGRMGSISDERLDRIRERLAGWVQGPD